ncbi:UNVERIFIED_CONTAM: hypothetical protein GTU68_060484 [Idotea baltica]|nr:hypothetical protein [Idotea baltica]
MGVSGCGKSTIAELIALQLDAYFLDADDLHPPRNKRLMSDGIQLTDDDRTPWLAIVRDHAKKRAENQICVVACSALKRRYRELLNQAGEVCYVFLDGPKALIQDRIHARTGHFMPESLLDSQLEALEPPINEDRVVAIEITSSPTQIAQDAINALTNAKLIEPAQVLKSPGS